MTTIGNKLTKIISAQVLMKWSSNAVAARVAGKQTLGHFLRRNRNGKPTFNQRAQQKDQQHKQSFGKFHNSVFYEREK